MNLMKGKIGNYKIKHYDRGAILEVDHDIKCKEGLDVEDFPSREFQITIPIENGATITYGVTLRYEFPFCVGRFTEEYQIGEKIDLFGKVSVHEIGKPPYDYDFPKPDDRAREKIEKEVNDFFKALNNFKR